MSLQDADRVNGAWKEKRNDLHYFICKKQYQCYKTNYTNIHICRTTVKNAKYGNTGNGKTQSHAKNIHTVRAQTKFLLLIHIVISI